MMRKCKILFLLVLSLLVNSFCHPAEAGQESLMRYGAHVEDIGWQDMVTSGVAGTVGQSKRMEALIIDLEDNGKSMVTYRAHVPDVGWQSWRNSGEIAGTTGQSKAIEAVQIQLVDTYASLYDIYYRVHVAYFGWLDWCSNGAVAGSTGMGLRTEAIEIKLVSKGTYVATGNRSELVRPYAICNAHCQDVGWCGNVAEGAVAGTTGMSRRLEALIIYLNDFNGNSGALYRTHVSGIGWMDWKNAGEISGTVNQSRAIEAIQIQLTSELGKCFDIYYRLHVASCGWMGWAKNGESAGTTGGGVRAEAIQIRLVPKGSSFNTEGVPYVDLTPSNTTGQSSSGAKIKLTHYMNTSLKQGDHTALVNKDGKNVGCCATSYAIGLSIVRKAPCYPENYWNGSQTVYTGGHVKTFKHGFDASAIYNQLSKGYPTLLNYVYRSGGEHWVLIIGVYEGADVNNLKYSDFITIDPATGREVALTDAYNFKSSDVCGYKLFF